MSPTKKLLWAVRRTLGLSPMQQVMRELEWRGVHLHDLSALEIFAYSGFMHTRDYHRRVARLEAWELDPQLERALHRNLPEAEIKITDSYEEIKRTTRKYGLILVDAPESVYGDRGQYCEHFRMLPEVFRVAEDSAVVIVNALIGYPNGQPTRRPLTETHLQYRRQFYGIDHPERLSFADMMPVYCRILEEHGFKLEWHFAVPRTSDKRLYYLVLKMKRVTPLASKHETVNGKRVEQLVKG